MIAVTIITVTYQAEHTLQRTLDSVRCQDYPHMEHLIIDGASTDDTVALARQYQADCPYSVVIRSEKDRGLYDAMNKGLRLATGHYLVFLNAGDTLYAPDTISTVVRAASGQEAGVIYGDTAVTDGMGRFLHLRRHRPPEKLTWRSFREGMLVCHQAFYARTDIARLLPYDLDFRHSADVDWCIRVMRESERQHLPLVNTHAILCNFEEGGDTTRHHRASLLERFRVMVRHYGMATTLLMHCWFVLRQIKSLRRNDTSGAPRSI